MSGLSIAFALLFYLAIGLLAGGLSWKIFRYLRTPAPLRIPTTPAPVSAIGVVRRLAGEVIVFTSLFKASKWTWFFGWLFHFALLFVLVAHTRFFMDELNLPIVYVYIYSPYAAWVMLIGLGGLWIRRVAIDRMRYISSLSDHLMLALLVGIGSTGYLMRTTVPTDVSAVRSFINGVTSFDWQPLPSDPLLLLHLSMVLILVGVFPFSKLLHAPGVFLSPTRNQTDNTRESRHVNPWDKRPASDIEER